MAPIKTTSRPSQYKQSSRKGKKAWRKNIDLSSIEKFQEESIEQEITHGSKDIANVKDADLFAVDTAGDEILKQKLIKRKQIAKNLKSREILDSVRTNSKVAALAHPKKSSKTVQNVSKKEIGRLMALAGRVDGKSSTKTRMAKDGLVKSDAVDLWDTTGKVNKSNKISVHLPSGIKLEVANKDEVPEELLTNSTTSWSIPTMKPSTLDRAPVKVKDYAKLPHAGKSYNPNTKDWSKLIDKEFKLEQVKENNRIAQQEYKEKIKHLMKVLEDDQEESSEEESENEENKIEEEESDDGEIRLSINEPVKNKKKTKYQRNKSKKHEEKLKVQKELKKLKLKLKELENFDEIEEEVAIDHELNAALKEKAQVTKKMNKKHRLGTKFSVMEDTLEVKFRDELSDSLRKMRPEGNLLYDTVRKLQSSGRIETRIPVKRGRRYKQKVTEKWTYKDFK